MSRLHSDSCDGTMSELDLFAMPATQTSMEHGDWIPHKPTTSISDGGNSIEFVAYGKGDSYIDLAQTQLHLTAKITKPDGTPLTQDFQAGPVNNWFHSVISQVDLTLNQTLVTQSNNAYPYRCYLENLLDFDTPAKESHLTSRLWYKDEAGKMDAMDNNGLVKRMSFTNTSQMVDMVGHVSCDFFNQERYLLNGVEMCLKFTKSKDAFQLMTAEAGGAKATIVDATLYVRKVRMNSTILLAHNRALAIKPAKYPMTRVDIKAITLSPEIQSKTIGDIYRGRIPKSIIIGFVSNAAFNGSFTKNPFFFHHYNLNFLSLYIGGHPIPAKPLQPDFGSKQYIRAYNSLFAGTGIHYKDKGNSIDREEYAKGYTLMAFDLTPDLSAQSEHWGLINSGELSLEMRFKEALAETVTCLLYAEFDSVVEIDRHRNVLTDFSN